MQSLIKVAIFASGSGSNAESILKYSKENSFEVVCVITDKENAGVIKRAEAYNVPIHILPYVESKAIHEKKILEELNLHEVNWIFLAGYMRILSNDFLTKYFDSELGLSRVINIHPSLLPSFPGKDAYSQAYNAGVKLSGATVHFVDAGVDTGPPIYQASFERKADDTLESFVERGLQVEYELYRKAIHAIINNLVTLKDIPNNSKKIVYIKDEL